MPGISILKLFTIFGIVSSWSNKALEDGKISLNEAAELATDLGAHLGIPVDVYIASPVTEHFEPSAAEKTGNPTPDIEEEQPPEERPRGR